MAGTRRDAGLLPAANRVAAAQHVRIGYGPLPDRGAGLAGIRPPAGWRMHCPRSTAVDPADERARWRRLTCVE